MSGQDSLTSLLQEAAASDAFGNYLESRRHVLAMLEEQRRLADEASAYWAEELAAFDYMLDASPLIIRKLRHHCYHLTGLQSYDYRGHHMGRGGAFAAKLAALRDEDRAGLFVPESPNLGGFGHDVGGALVNLDTLKFYECMIALEKAGFLEGVRSPGSGRPIVVEIGAGWGGFAYQFKTVFPHVTYVIVDLPQSLLFSATYLKTMFPAANVYEYDPGAAVEPEAPEHWDLVFLPSWALGQIAQWRPDLAVNMVSFQEMRADQVDRFAALLHGMGCSRLYSLNRDRSPHNSEIVSVRRSLEPYYRLEEVRVLGYPYNFLSPDRRVDRVRRGVGRLLRAMLPDARAEDRTFRYRHVVGHRRARD